MTESKTFGLVWSRALCAGCARLSELGSPVPPEWVLAIFALESGFDPEVLQGHARLVPPAGPDDMRPIVTGTGGLRLSHGTGARGLFQMMPTRVVRKDLPDIVTLYPVTSPLAQLADAITFWENFAKRHDVKGGFKHRAALYACNLAPARLMGGAYDAETIIYSANPDDQALNAKGGAFTKTYWPAAFRANAPAFAVEADAKRNPDQRLRMRDLEVGLDRAVSTNRARYDAEFEAAYVANVRPT